jgi:hypothetical protein
MIMVGLSRRIVLCGLIVVSVVFGIVSSAFAASPWWHLTSGARPTTIQPGKAVDEVQEITVSATGGELFLVEPVAFEKEELIDKKVNASS